MKWIYIRGKVLLFYLMLSVCETELNGDSFQNLGDMISKQVRQNINNMNRNMQGDMRNIYSNIGTNMNSVTNNLHSEMQTLQNSIQTQVQNSLKPVQALSIMAGMANGLGGVTVANYGGRKTLLIINGEKYTCPGIITYIKNKVTCSAEIIPYNQDVCTGLSYSRLNNLFCFGNRASIQCFNNDCKCTRGRTYTLDVLKALCGKDFGTSTYIEYKYFPNTSDFNHIPIPNPNEYVNCKYSTLPYCVWYGNGIVSKITN